METSTLGEMFDDRLDNIQNQIDQLKEQVSNTLSPSTTAQPNTYIISHRGPTLEEENKHTSDARDMPDSEGFWRDDDGDVWVRDTAGTMLIIAKGSNQDGNEIYSLSSNFNSDSSSDSFMHEYGPYVKIDNPFIQGEDHAN